MTDRHTILPSQWNPVFLFCLQRHKKVKRQKVEGRGNRKSGSRRTKKVQEKKKEERKDRKRKREREQCSLKTQGTITIVNILNTLFEFIQSN